LVCAHSLEVRSPGEPFTSQIQESFASLPWRWNCYTIEHLRAFSNACAILGVNNNDSCMLLFMNSLQGDVASLFSSLPDGCISTWFELSYWFTSTFGHLDNPYEHLKRFNQLRMKDNESILTFNLQFIKLYNLIPTPILPTNLVALLHYYELFPPLYRWRLEEKNVQNLELALSTCLNFEEQNRRTGYSFGIYDSHKELSSLIPVIKSLQDRMSFLESQSSNHTGSISREPSLLGTNHNESNTCGRELEYDEDHDYIMMLNDQSTSHTLLKPHTQNHLSSQASYLHAYNGNFDYANEEINANYVKPIYDTFVFDDDANEWSNDVDQYDFNDACNKSFLKTYMSSIKILICIKFSLILCFNQKRIKNLALSSMSLLAQFLF
jgi:hypothetical protein